MRAHGVTPILNVSSLTHSYAWLERLGWRKLWDHGDPPTFAAVGNGACEIFLCLDGQGGRGDGQGVWLTIWVDNVDSVYATCLTQDLEVIRPPATEPWGVRELHLRHPDGHIFRISRGADHDHDHPHDHDHDHDHEHGAGGRPTGR